MQCPGCSADLERSEYEGLPVFSCTGCQGYLVATRRMADIARVRQKSADELLQETGEAGAQDSAGVLRCPRCRQRMDKEFQKGVDSFHIDKCGNCELVWFDAGELACWQLAYEATGRAQEAKTYQDKHRQMDPATKRQFEENLARLPEPESALEAAVRESFMDQLGRALQSLWR